MVKNLLAIILLIVHVISGTEFREVAKLPVLFQHYSEHRQLDATITFTKFLVDHYNNIPHTDNDEDRDNDLPFKGVETNIHTSPVITATFAVTLRKPVQPVVSDDPYPRNDNRIPSASISKIWQPPKSGSLRIA